MSQFQAHSKLTDEIEPILKEIKFLLPCSIQTSKGVITNIYKKNFFIGEQRLKLVNFNINDLTEIVYQLNCILNNRMQDREDEEGIAEKNYFFLIMN